MTLFRGVLSPKYLKLGEFRGAALQTIAGYMSAALGLLCELAIAFHHGASSVTDIYRWAGLPPFYLGGVIGAVLAPVYFRGRLITEGKVVGLVRVDLRGTYSFQRWVWTGWAVTAIFGIGTVLLLPLIGAVIGALALSVIAGFALLAFSLFALPLFYRGSIWVFVAANAVLNGVLATVLLSGRTDFADTLVVGFFIFLVVALLCGALIAPLVNSRGSKSYLRELEHEPHSGGVRALAPVLAVHLCGATAVIIYFRLLTQAGGGLLSVYSLAQKVQLFLGVPGAALLNKYLREQTPSIANRAGETSVVTTIRAIVPLVCLGPLFGVISYIALCMIYNVSINSALFHALMVPCSTGAGFGGVSLCMSMLPLARTGAAQMVYGAIIAPCVALLAWGAVGVFGLSSAAVLGLPFIGGGIAGFLSLLWIAHRTGDKRWPAAALFVFSCVLTFATLLALSMPWACGAVSIVRGTAIALYSLFVGPHRLA